MQVDYRARINNLLQRAGTDVVALVPGANMVYFTGLHFHLSERPTIALFTQNGVSFIIPELETAKLKQRPELEIKPYSWKDSEGFSAVFRQAARDLHLGERQLGVDGQTMRVFEWLAFKKAGVSSKNAMDVGRVLLGIRSRKSAEEVDSIRKAIKLSEEALRQTMLWVKIGMAEQEIATRLNMELKSAGSESNAFEPIVLTGPNSALPHGLSGSRQLQRDEFLLIDFGGKANEYPADITRTFVIGQPNEQMRAIYDAVLRANLAAQQAARPGVSCAEVDRAARKVIEDAGYGDYFIHRTGHGLGLEGHEWPNIVGGNDMDLEVGMVFTIEPGIYLPDVGGVRIEDNVVVTETGVEVLTSYPRDL